MARRLRLRQQLRTLCLSAADAQLASLRRGRCNGGGRKLSNLQLPQSYAVSVKLHGFSMPPVLEVTALLLKDVYIFKV